MASATHFSRPKERGMKKKDEEDEELFDAATAVLRCDKLRRMMNAHDVPDDKVEGVVLFVEGIKRLVVHFGPKKMGTFSALFCDAWRQFEGEVITQILNDTVLKSIFADMETPSDKIN